MVKREGINNSSLIIGMPGSGKTYFAKEEISELLKEDNTKVYIIDLGRDYLDFAKERNGVILSPNNTDIFINPFDYCSNKIDAEDLCLIPSKFNFIASLIEELSGQTLNSKQCAVLDKHLIAIYKDYFDFIQNSDFEQYVQIINRDLCPTIVDLCNSLSSDDSVDAKEILNLIDSDLNKKKYLEHKTNLCLPSDKNLFVYNISHFNCCVLEYYLCLSDIWNRIKENKDNRLNTYVYLEGVDILLDNHSMQGCISSLWKCSRKFSASFTGILQYADEDFAYSNNFIYLLNNSAYYFLFHPDRKTANFFEKIGVLTDEQIEQIPSMPINQGFVYYDGSLKKISF